MNTPLELLETAIHGLTKDSVEIEEVDSQSSTLIKITAPRSEYGKICGARGKMINSIKHIWEFILSRAIGKPLRVTLLEPSGGYRSERMKNPSPDSFNAEYIQNYALDLISMFSAVQVGWEKDEFNRYKYTIQLESHLKSDTKECLQTLLSAMAKAKGGDISISYNG